MTQPRTAKDTLRRAVLARRTALSPDERQAAADALRDVAMPWLASLAPARLTIAGYCPIRGEIDPLPLMAALGAAGHRLALPRMEGEGLVFHAYKAGDALEKRAFGVPEPLLSMPVLRPDLILAPLVAFDRRGHRLGYGKGFYDRALAAHPAARGIGLAFALQEVPHVPDEAHDTRLLAIITETGVINPA